MSPRDAIVDQYVSKRWKWVVQTAVTVMIPVTLALGGFLVEVKVLAQDHSHRIHSLEEAERARSQKIDTILDTLTKIQVAIGRLEERIR